MDLETMATGVAQHGARWVLWCLLACSLAGLALALERALVHIFSRADVGRLGRDVRAELSGGREQGARRLLSESPAFEAKVALPALTARSRDELELGLEGALVETRLELERGLTSLGSIASTAPFIGLLGTVIGVLRAFAALGAAGGKLSGALMTEIGEALLATAVGLCVALPALAAFNAFQRLTEVRLGRGRALALGLWNAAQSGRASEAQ